MPYVIECDRLGLLPHEFDSADEASTWLDSQEDETVAEYAEQMLKVLRAYMWTQYPTATLYPYLMRMNAATDEVEEAIQCAREFYAMSRMIRYHEWEGIHPTR